MDLASQIEQDFKSAMKNKEAEKLQTLRLVRAALTNYLIEKKIDKPSDEDIINIIQKQAKQRRESIDSYLKAGRKDLSQKEESELAILTSYLPKQLTHDEIKAFVQGAILESEANSVQDMGKIMKYLMPKIKGRADGKLVNQIILAAFQEK